MPIPLSPLLPVPRKGLLPASPRLQSLPQVSTLWGGGQTLESLPDLLPGLLTPARREGPASTIMGHRGPHSPSPGAHWLGRWSRGCGPTVIATFPSRTPTTEH